MSLRLRIWAAVLLCAVSTAAPAAETRQQLREDRAELDGKWQQLLAGLAAEYRGQLPQQAAFTLQWPVARDPRRLYVFLPAAAEPPPAGESERAGQWRRRFMELRQAYAAKLFALAERTVEVDPAAAYRLLHEVLREDPEHAAARKILGWTGRERPLQAVRTPRPQPALALPRQHWRVRSRHFEVLSDHSEAAALQLAEELETLHAVWSQVFFTFWNNGAALQQQLARRSAPSRRAAYRRHKVVLYRSRDKYVSVLKQHEPRIDVTVGIYLNTPRTSFFYQENEPKLSTWRHEATHQLFSEHSRATGVGLRGNFWIVEGVALYMESLRPMAGYCTLGGIDADRLQFARYRRLADQFHVRSRELAAMGRGDLQRSDDIRRLYSQAAGITSFLMDERQGAHRQAVCDLLTAVYQKRDSAAELFQLTGLSPDELDEQYLRYLADVSDADLKFVGPVENLCLRQTRITDAGLRQLQDVSQLQWLDVTDTRVGDAGASVLERAGQLRQLSLERTGITDATLQLTSNWPRLEELDLTATAVTDRGMPHLTQARNLQVLWLTGTQVTDDCLPQLQQLRQLRTLDVQQSHITSSGLQRLRQALPQLEK